MAEAFGWGVLAAASLVLASAVALRVRIASSSGYVELEHGSVDPQTDVTGDDPIITGKIALAHTKEFPDYYVRLERIEHDAEDDWSSREH